MICRNCFTENADDAVFCKHCGKRLDGQKVCPRCERLNTEDSLYCTCCGARLETQTIDKGGMPVSDAASDAAVPEMNANTKEMLRLAGNILALLLAAVSLLFVCLIGMGTSTGSTQVDAGVFGIDAGFSNLFYFFHDAYRDVRESLQELLVYGGVASTSEYLCAILGTVVAAASLAAVVTMCVLTVVRVIANLRGKTEKTADAFAVAAFLSFTAGASLLLLFFSASVKVAVSGANGSCRIGYNGTTVAGLAVGAVLLALTAGLRLVQRRKELFSASAAYKALFALSALLCLALAWGFFVSSAGGLVLIASSSERVTCSFGALNLISLIGETYSWEEFPKLDSSIFQSYMLSVGAVVTAIATVVLFALLVMRRVRKYGEEDVCSVVLSSVALATAVAHLVLFAIALSLFAEEYFGNRTVWDLAEYRKFFTNAIVAVVFTALNLAASVAHYSLAKRANSLRKEKNDGEPLA